MTGAAGFIGSRLLKKLIEGGHEVTALKRESTDLSRVESLDCKWILEAEIPGTLNSGIDAVIHMATTYGRDDSDPAPVWESNFTLPLDLLMAASKAGTPLFINTDSFFTRELAGGWNPDQKVYMNAYTRSKFAFRETARTNIPHMHTAFVNMELQHVYGAGDGDGKFVSFMKKSLLANVPELDLTEGKQLRDWIYSDDVANAYIAVLNDYAKFPEKYCRGSFTEYEAGTGISTSLKEVCLMMKEISGASTKLNFGAREMNPNELMESVADNSSLKAIGWTPEVTLKEGLSQIFRD